MNCFLQSGPRTVVEIRVEETLQSVQLGLTGFTNDTVSVY